MLFFANEHTYKFFYGTGIETNLDSSINMLGYPACLLCLRKNSYKIFYCSFFSHLNNTKPNNNMNEEVIFRGAMNSLNKAINPEAGMCAFNMMKIVWVIYIYLWRMYYVSVCFQCTGWLSLVNFFPRVVTKN